MKRRWKKMKVHELAVTKYRTEVFVQTEPVLYRARFVQKDLGPIFLCTYRASEVNKKFIISWHLYLKQTRFEMQWWFEMHISSVVHIWSKKTKNTSVFLLFHLKHIRRYLINNKVNYNFQIFNCFAVLF
jgi:hypothetical protein